MVYVYGITYMVLFYNDFTKPLSNDSIKSECSSLLYSVFEFYLLISSTINGARNFELKIEDLHTKKMKKVNYG